MDQLVEVADAGAAMGVLDVMVDMVLDVVAVDMDVVVVDDATSDPDDVLALQVATKFAEEHGWRYACSGPCVVWGFCS